MAACLGLWHLASALTPCSCEESLLVGYLISSWMSLDLGCHCHEPPRRCLVEAARLGPTHVTLWTLCSPAPHQKRHQRLLERGRLQQQMVVGCSGKAWKMQRGRRGKERRRKEWMRRSKAKLTKAVSVTVGRHLAIRGALCLPGRVHSS